MDLIVPSTNPSPTTKLDSQEPRPKKRYTIPRQLEVMGDFFRMATERALKARQGESSGIDKK
jgi:hypothetical protein